MLALLSTIIKDQVILAIVQTYQVNERENQIQWGWPGWDKVLSAEFGAKTPQTNKKNKPGINRNSPKSTWQQIKKKIPTLRDPDNY